MQSRLGERLKRVYTGRVWANTALCEACWDCVGACPRRVIGKVGFLWHKHVAFRDPQNCTGCKKCVETCRRGVFSEGLPDALKGAAQRFGAGG